MERRMGSVPVTFDNLTQSGNRVSVTDELDQVVSLQVCLWGIVLITYYLI